MRIELKNITLRFEDKAPLLEDVNFVLGEGDFVLIRGESGCGKSSLLHLLNRLEEPSAGQILVDGQPIASYEVTQLRRQLGFVQQTPVMVEGTVRENLLYPFSFKAARGQTEPGDEALRVRLDEFLLTEVELRDDAELLSVGQKQRVALIRTLLTQPRVLLCDEATSALDPRSKSVVEEALERENTARGVSVALVTHLEFVPQIAKARRYLMRAGKLENTP